MGVLYLATDESLDNLVAAAQAAATDDTAAMAAILTRFEGAAWAIARSLTSNWCLQQDAAQGARLGLVKAVRSHNLGTLGFPAYAKRYMRGTALRTVLAVQGEERCVDPQEYVWPDAAPRDAAPDTTFEVIDLIAVLSPEQQAITKAHYVDDARLSDVARDMGISVPAASQRLVTIHRALRTVVEEALAA
jgi:RNA polymerase sigma factor (sigma-70 family)